MKEKIQTLGFEKEAIKIKFQEFFPIKSIIMMLLVWEEKKDSKNNKNVLKIRKISTDNNLQNKITRAIKKVIPNDSFLEFFNDIMSSEFYVNKDKINLLSNKIENKNLISQIKTKLQLSIRKYITDFLFFAKISKEENEIKEKLSLSKNFLLKGGSTITQLIIRPIEYNFFASNNPLISLLTSSATKLIMFGICSWQLGPNAKKSIPSISTQPQAIVVTDPHTNKKYIFDKLDDAIKFILKNKWYILLLYILFIFRQPIINILNSIREDILKNPTIANSLKHLQEKHNQSKDWLIEIYRNIRGYSKSEIDFLMEQIDKLRRKFKALQKIIEHLNKKIEMDAEKIKKYKDYSSLFKKELVQKEFELAELNKILKYVEKQFPECLNFIEDLQNNGVPDNGSEDINLDMNSEME
jgi:hypothetical protein